jgi:hypothetical protein
MDVVSGQPNTSGTVCTKSAVYITSKWSSGERFVMIMAIVASSRCSITTKNLEFNCNNISYQKSWAQEQDNRLESGGLWYNYRLSLMGIFCSVKWRSQLSCQLDHNIPLLLLPLSHTNYSSSYLLFDNIMIIVAIVTITSNILNYCRPNIVMVWVLRFL